MTINRSKLNFKDIIKYIAVLMSCYHLYTCVFGIPESQVHRTLHLLFALIIGFGVYGVDGKKSDGKLKIIDYVMVALSVLSLGYMIVN